MGLTTNKLASVGGLPDPSFGFGKSWPGLALLICMSPWMPVITNVWMWMWKWMNILTNSVQTCICVKVQKKIVAYVNCCFQLWLLLHLFFSPINNNSFPFTSCRSLILKLLLWVHFHFLAGSAATLHFYFILVLTYGSLSRWVRGWGHSWSPVHGWRCI